MVRSSHPLIRFDHSSHAVSSPGGRTSARFVDSATTRAASTFGSP